MVLSSKKSKPWNQIPNSFQSLQLYKENFLFHFHSISLRHDQTTTNNNRIYNIGIDFDNINDKSIWKTILKYFAVWFRIFIFWHHCHLINDSFNRKKRVVRRRMGNYFICLPFTPDIRFINIIPSTIKV